MNAPRDRDQAFERLLRQSLKTPRAGATASCLDAETLAAWAEGGLSGHELEIAQLHAADCARCQAALAVLVQTSSPDAVSGTIERAPRRWFAWLVPLTAAAVAIAIWVAVPHGPANERQQAAAVRNRAAQPKAPETPAPAIDLQQPATGKMEQPPAAERDQPQRDQAQASALSKDTDRRELDRLTQEPQSADLAANRADRPGAPPEPAAAPKPAVPPAAAAAPAPAAETRQAFQEVSPNAAAQKAAPIATLRTPGIPRWRIGGTNLERSTDGGSTWSPVATGVDAELTALSSPSPTVCWVVGRRGIVLRTADGESFSRLIFPEITDLSAVTAANAQTATVTAGDGRVFTTADGGASWRQVR